MLISNLLMDFISDDEYFLSYIVMISWILLREYYTVAVLP